jgi:signal transduction histidine kinase
MSLRARLLAAFAYTLLVVIVALEVPLANNLADRIDAEVRGEAAEEAAVLAAATSGRLDQPGYLQRISANSADQLGGRVVIVDASGRLLADSAAAAAAGQLYANDQRPELVEALGGHLSQKQRYSDTLGEDLLATAVPILEGQRTAGALRVTQAVGTVNEEIRSDVLALVGIGVLALALGLGVAWILAGSIARPVRELAGVARRRARGDLGARATPSGSSEQMELARGFNEMADRLEGVLESQRAFVADASHQLRTPLTGLRLRIEAAVNASRDPAVGRELEAAERETKRLADLVNELLTLASSEQPVDAEPGSLEDAVSAAARRWRVPAEESGRTLRVAEAGPLARVRAPAADLAIVLDNLIENAIKYSKRGSVVEVDWAADDGAAAIRVSNEGEPLAAEDAERAFERFYRGAAGRRGSGTGLGLAIVTALVRRSGGSARLANAPGGRVTAEVELPLANSDFANS